VAECNKIYAGSIFSPLSGAPEQGQTLYDLAAPWCFFLPARVLPDKMAHLLTTTHFINKSLFILTFKH